MSGAPSTSLEAALDLATRRGQVLLVCWPDDAGRCACPGVRDGKRMVPHQGKDVGKAPFAKGGYTAATSDPEQIRQRWGKYPDANVGVWLEGSGWAAIDADSPLASAEAHKLGMLQRPIRHSRHQAYLFKLPEDAPIERVIHAGSDGKLDILSEGHLVAYGRHAEGHQVWIDWNGLAELNPLDQWAVDLLIRRAAEKDASIGPVGEEGKPTPLSDQEVIARARGSEQLGERFASLYDTGGLELIGACPCTPKCAPSCPHKPTCTGRRCPAKCTVKPYPSESERDLALMNILRFWGGADTARMERLFSQSAPGKRPKWDSSASYRKATLAKALNGKVWQPGSASPDPTPLEQIEQSGSDGAEMVSIPRAELDRILTENADLRAGYTRMAAVFSNKELVGSKKLAALVATFEIVSMDSRDRQDRRLSSARIAEKAGISKSAAGDAMALLSGPAGVFIRAERWEKINPYTGEIHEQPHRVVEYRPKFSSVAATMTALADFKAPTEEGKKGWGGPREKTLTLNVNECTCPDHPEAGSVVHCAAAQCNRSLTVAVPADPSRWHPSSQDDFMGDAPPSRSVAIPMQRHLDLMGEPPDPASHGVDVSLSSQDDLMADQREPDWLFENVERIAAAESARLDKLEGSPRLCTDCREPLPPDRKLTCTRCTSQLDGAA
jgi:Bifunctional DNA primase/polymerase, N-terminal/NrS-1  polymerase HBD domain